MSPGKSILEVFDQMNINPTLYNYNVNFVGIRNKQHIIKSFAEKIDLVTQSQGWRPFPTENLRSLQFFVKSFNPLSFYEIHAEPIQRYGEYTFIYFLEDCQGGELVFASEETTQKHLKLHPEMHEPLSRTQDVFKRLNEPLRWAGDHIIKPQKNTCVLFKVGSVHWVNPLDQKSSAENTRLSIAGWPLASPELLNDLNINCGLKKVFEDLDHLEIRN